MNKKVLCLILAVFLTSACAQNQDMGLAVEDGGQKVPVAANNDRELYCVKVDLPADPECPDPANLEVNINISGGGSPSMTVAPPFICVNQGDALKFRINGPASGPHEILPGGVAVAPKNSGSSWITGTNYSDKEEINIAVPDWLPDGTDYDYRVFTASGVCVDPRVHVR